jgi:RHS repeat-associated protein
MRNILKKALYLLVFISVKLFAQTPAVITKPETLNTNYIVTGIENLLASESITLKTGTWIKAGSTFSARVNSDAYIQPTYSNENYIFTRTFQALMTSSAGIKSNKDVMESITYFDGLGRPEQQIGIKASPGKQDIVAHMGYDNFGRKDKEYLPYLDVASTIASYRTGAAAKTNSYYISNYPADINSASPNPFSQKSFDNSPLNRVAQQGAPGSSWAIGSGHEIKSDYSSNTVADNVKLFNAITLWKTDLGLFDITLGNSEATTFYGKGQLTKTIIKDENWVPLAGNYYTTEEFKDKEGKVILKKTYGTSVVNGINVGTAHETYYVYDIYGNLTLVIPPKADGAISPAVLDNLCYQYKYDDLNRLVEKKLPGKDWEYIVYDKLDRPILTQDGNLRKDSNNNPVNKWIFTKYDALSRPVYSGEYLNTVQTTRLAVQELANTSSVIFENKQASVLNINGTNVYYSKNTFPNTGIDLFTINYYDDYLNIDLDGGTAAVSYGITPITNAKGLATCTKVRILGTSNWTTTTNYYDAKGRPIYNYSRNNYLDATSSVKTQLDFGGKTLETISTHKKGTDPLITFVDTYTYDHAGRLLTQKQTINSQTPEVIASNTYDNLGQLITKSVGGKTTQSRLQNVDYTYNIRGWLKNINNINTIGNDLFAFSINYNDINSRSTPLFNGNISQTTWRTANTDTNIRDYTYIYDELNRLAYALGDQDDQQEIPTYDKNGNIISMYRTDDKPKNSPTSKKVMQTIDNLVYTYDGGNRLIKVEDSTGNSEGFKNGVNLPTEYTYDLNGNMLTDANKGITAIKYNYLNLPEKVTLSNGVIDYKYDAAGIKQRKIVSGVTTDYADSFVYENNVLKQFAQPEGYVVYNAGTYNYIYQYKDHLGNIRLSYQDKDNNGSVNTTEIVQENNYYPFGMMQKGYNSIVNGVDNKYKFNGKELQDELGLNFYDYGFRNYDPTLGRWMNIDPLAEVSRRFSPYTYALNNPVFFIDPDGRSDYNFQTGEYASGSFESAMSKQGLNTDGTEKNTGSNEDPPKKGNSWGDKFRKMADSASKWVDNAFGNDARQVADNASQWATDYSEAHTSIGAGDIWARQMEPIKELYELGFGATGVGISNTRSFAKFAPEGYTVAAEKFDYFFGKVNSSPGNMRRSLQNLKDLKEMGLASRSALIRIFNKAFSSGTEVSTQITPHGTTIMKQVKVGEHALNVGFFYKGSNMDVVPAVTTVITKLKR